MLRKRKGQSILEYVIILAAIVGAVIAVTAVIKPKISSTYGDLTDKVVAKAGEVTF